MACRTAWRRVNTLINTTQNYFRGRCGVVGSTHAFGSIGHGFESEHRLFSHHIASAFSKLRALTPSSSTSLYLNSSVARYLPSRTLRSQNTNLLAVPRTKTVFGSHAFHVAAPTVFNSLPQDIRSTNNISAFCRLLKTFYFRNAFNQH